MNFSAKLRFYFLICKSSWGKVTEKVVDSHALLNFRMWFKNGLKAQKLQKQHALKGQKLLAQGIALGMMAISKTPCKGKSFMFCLEF